MVSENFDIEFQSRFDELMKARRASVGEIRRYGKFDYRKTPYGWVYVGENKLYQINEQFNKMLDKQIKGELSNKYVYELGKPENILLSAGFPNKKIQIAAQTLSLKSSKKYKNNHPFDLRDVRNLPFALNHPIFIFNSKTQPTSKVVITDLKSNNVNLLIALQIDFKEKDAIVISIRSIYPKESQQSILNWVNEGLLVWRDKKKALKFSSKLQSNSADVRENTSALFDAVNIIRKFENANEKDSELNIIKDKLRKAIPEEIAFEREVIADLSPTIQRKKDESLPTCSSPSLSLPKGTTNMNDMQQFVDEIIEKSKKGAPIGTERTWGGKVYIRTENGWKPKSGAKKAKKEDDQTDKTSSKVNDVNSYASKASDEQLQAAINDKDALPEVKQAAQEELNKRNPKEENNSNTGITDALQRLLAAQEKGEIDLGEEVLGKIKDKLESQKQKKSESLTEETLDKKLDKLKEDITSKIDEKLNELNGFKKITQTYVKQDGKTIVIKMKGDNQYKASSPGFKLESKPYESLVDFKKRIKEEFNKQFSKIEDKEENNIQDQEKDKKTILNFKDKGEYNEYVLRRNSEKENLTKDQIDRFNKAFVEYENDIKDFPEKKLNEIKSYIESQNFNKILHVYSGFTPDSKMVLNRELINQGYLPIANGMLYSIYNNKKYKHFDNQDDKRKFYYAKKSTPNLVETKALEYYMDMGYNSVRAVNIGKEKNTTVEQISSTISSFIDKNPIKDNVVLNRRMSVDSDNINNLNQWLEANVGDVIEDKSFTSFSLDQISSFGNDIQITLLAKKGDKISNINNDFEYEYLVQKNSKYKVIAKGTNSIVVELV
jgi:hypothetical protein